MAATMAALEQDKSRGAHFDGKTTACLLSSSCVATFLGYINIPRSETPCWEHKTHAVFCRRDKMRTTPALALPAGSWTGRFTIKEHGSGAWYEFNTAWLFSKLG